MYKENQYKGMHCHICTGCGRCMGADSGIDIVSKNLLAKKNVCDMEGTLSRCLVAIDIGTTTVAMQLYDLDGSLVDVFVCVNPQVEYGADVLSRIQAAANPVKAAKMQRMIRDVLKRGIDRFKKYACDTGLYMVLAANTTMIYLLMGYDTAELGRAPFMATHLQEMRIEIEGVPCYIFPGISAFVGGDIVAGIYASEMLMKEELTLLIDLGTNGEMVLGNAGKQIACSTAAGPAFEGGPNRGIWGADMISILAKLSQDGIVDETGLLSENYFEEGILIGGVHVTQQAIRNIQLAKAAIATGIDVLVQEFGITMGEIEKVVLAGGFGYYLNPKDAASIGLLPKELAGVTVAGGNIALAGVTKYGKNLLETTEICVMHDLHEMISKTRILNIANIKGFEEMYLQRINIK